MCTWAVRMDEVENARIAQPVIPEGVNESKYAQGVWAGVQCVWAGVGVVGVYT